MKKNVAGNRLKSVRRKKHKVSLGVVDLFPIHKAGLFGE